MTSGLNVGAGVAVDGRVLTIPIADDGLVLAGVIVFDAPTSLLSRRALAGLTDRVRNRTYVAREESISTLQERRNLLSRFPFSNGSNTRCCPTK
jgi:hypothetical protein